MRGTKVAARQEKKMIGAKDRAYWERMYRTKRARQWLRRHWPRLAARIWPQ